MRAALRIPVFLLAALTGCAQPPSPDQKQAQDEILRELRTLKTMVADLQARIERLEKSLATAPVAAPAQSKAAVPLPPTTSGAARPQCAATTKAGRRCSRIAAEGSRFCWQHK
ncbi:MAG: hypothetical protein ACRD96_24100 [Bryobacteraceae bacterium]